MNEIGYVIDGSTPVKIRFVAKHPPPPGDFITVETDEGEVLALVERVGTRSVSMAALSGVYEPDVVAKLGSSRDAFFECVASSVGVIERNSLRLPKKPPLPGTPVRLADNSILYKIFGGSEPRKVRLGVLAARPDIPVYVDVNSMVTRHLAILAVTGAGKSNTVAVLADRIVRIGGTVVILDFHGEYVDSDIGGSVNVIEPKLNPNNLSLAELMVLLGIEPHYYHQERVLRKAYEKVRESNDDKPFLSRLLKAVESLKRVEDTRAAIAVANKVENLMEKYGEIIDDSAPDIVYSVKPGAANVIDLGRVDEEAADVVTSHVLRRLLAERKRKVLTGKGFPVPVLAFIEEAHILAPRDRDTLSKYWMARIAREGRKFGVGLAIVSQRPKIIDQDILSQMNSKIVLRIVEPTDQRYVREASELLSEELAEQLSSLNTGEAIVLGPIVPIPVIVKVDRYGGRKGGADPDVVGEWVRARKEVEEAMNAVEELKDLVPA